MKERGSQTSVGVVGLGHVGLCTAVAFASRRIATIGIDVDEEKVRSISRGKAPFVEKDLPGFLSRAISSKRLTTSSDASELASAAHIFITVPTPNSHDGSIDLSFVKSAIETIGGVLKESRGYKVVVVKSTVTPGTALNELLPTITRAAGKKLGEFGLASNPEFLREGHAIEDTLHPDRIVIGTEDRKSQRGMLSLYRTFYGRLPRCLLTTTVNAELVKYASNSFLATRVSFINEIANLCARLQGADVSVVAEGMGLDSRIGRTFLRAGLGFGGSCFPKDVSALLMASEAAGAKLGVVEAAALTNKSQPFVAVDLAEGLVGDLRGKRVALLGLAFKPESDDMRDAVSLELIPRLVEKGAAVVAYDPAAMENARAKLGETIEYASSARECLRRADCCILVTEWPQFSRLRPVDFKGLMRVPAVVDGRRLFSADSFLKSGVKFSAVGLGPRKTT